MKTPYRILKLRSGEQIIARLRGEQRGKIVIERPMIFVTRVIMDPYTGKQKELTILKNWLSHTNEIQTKIPKDYIATYLIPTSDVMELYSLEKEKEDVDPKDPKITNLTEMMKDDLGSDMKSVSDMLPEDFEDLIDMMRDAIDENPELLEDLEEMESKNSISPQSKNFITMSMFLPPEALLTLVDAGLIDHEDVLDLIETLNGKVNRNLDEDESKISDLDTSDETDREDYGTKWTDWSSDPRDYFK